MNLQNLYTQSIPYDGKWGSYINTYIVLSKKIVSTEENISIMSTRKNKNRKSIIIEHQNNDKKSYPYLTEIIISDNKILKKLLSLTHEYNIMINHREVIKIRGKLRQLTYLECLYSINSNLKISITLLLQKNKIKCILFSSYIKKI